MIHQEAKSADRSSGHTTAGAAYENAYITFIAATLAAHGQKILVHIAAEARSGGLGPDALLVIRRIDQALALLRAADPLLTALEALTGASSATASSEGKPMAQKAEGAENIAGGA